MGERDDFILFLKLEGEYFIPDIDTLIKELEWILVSAEKTFVVLTFRQAPPVYTASEDELVYSFCCKFNHFISQAKYVDIDHVISTDLLFRLMDQMGKTHSAFERVMVRQFPWAETGIFEPDSYDIIIPHRGECSYLGTVLHFLKHIDKKSTYVGIDQQISPCMERLIAAYVNGDFYNFRPTPVGPYVIRNRLIEQGTSNLIFFQDSDDIPCYDRFSTISNHFKNSDCQMCGSHELRIDYYKKTVQAIRFPTDVRAALDYGPGFPLLHPTACITREAFQDCGMLSEERIFNNDTKFLLYSYFMLRAIHNIPEFLYIRRIHPGSLTTSPQTMLNSPLRRNLNYKWSCEFEKIKQGSMTIEESDLPPKKSKIEYNKWKIPN